MLESRSSLRGRLITAAVVAASLLCSVCCADEATLLAGMEASKGSSPITSGTKHASSGSVLDTIATSATAYWQAPGTDEVYNNLVCPEFLTLLVDALSKQKRCVMNITTTVTPGVAWGPVASYLWSGDLGYWAEESKDCPPMMSRERVPGLRMFCVVQIDFLELPPIRRIIPVWEHKNGVLLMGYAVAYQPDAPNSCPAGFSGQKGVCEEFNLGTGLEDFDTVVLRAAATSRKNLNVTSASSGQGVVIMTVATFDYAEGAMIWFHSLAAQGRTGMVVVALDLGSYIYLSNRGVAVVLVTTVAHLNPCCLHRFRMVPWRATNDVKVRSIIKALKLGIKVIMVDLDVHMQRDAVNMEYLSQFDLVFSGGYSFMYTYSAPTSSVIEMWSAVLEEVLKGGWDQAQFRFHGSLRVANHSINAGVLSYGHLNRAQNNFEKVMNDRLAATGSAKLPIGRVSNILGSQNLAQTAKQAVFVPASETAIDGHQSVLTSMLKHYPSPYSRFMQWHPSSDCASSGVSEFTAADPPSLRSQGWHLRKMCINALIRIGVWSQRYVVIPDNLAHAYNLDQLRRWFPIVLQSQYLKMMGASTSSPSCDTLEGKPASAPVTSTSSGCVISESALPLSGADSMTAVMVSAMQSNTTMLLLSGEPSALQAFSKAHCTLPGNLHAHMFLFLGPVAPKRLDFQCMRGPGPASPTNPDPKCAGGRGVNLLRPSLQLAQGKE